MVSAIFSVADPDLGSGVLAPGSRIRDEQPGTYFLELRNHFLGLKYLNSLMRIRDGKKSDPGSASATLAILHTW